MLARISVDEQLFTRTARRLGSWELSWSSVLRERGLSERLVRDLWPRRGLALVQRCAEQSIAIYTVADQTGAGGKIHLLSPTSAQS